MKLEIEVFDYIPERGLEIEWNADNVISAQLQGETVVIKANGYGLQALARHLLTLSQPKAPPGTHIHYDDLNGLERGSCEVIIEKLP
jgi:hypothetical protein